MSVSELADCAGVARKTVYNLAEPERESSADTVIAVRTVINLERKQHQLDTLSTAEVLEGLQGDDYTESV